MTLCSACGIWWYRIFACMSCTLVFVVLVRQSTGGSVTFPIPIFDVFSVYRGLDAVLWCLLRREMWAWLLCVAPGS